MPNAGLLLVLLCTIGAIYAQPLASSGPAASPAHIPVPSPAGSVFPILIGSESPHVMPHTSEVPHPSELLRASPLPRASELPRASGAPITRQPIRRRPPVVARSPQVVPPPGAPAETSPANRAAQRPAPAPPANGQAPAAPAERAEREGKSEMSVEGRGNGVIMNPMARVTIVLSHVDSNASAAYSTLEDHFTAFTLGTEAEHLVLDQEHSNVVVIPLVSVDNATGDRTWEFQSWMTWGFSVADYQDASSLIETLLGDNADFVEDIMISPDRIAYEDAQDMAMELALNDSISKADWLLQRLDRCFGELRSIESRVPSREESPEQPVPFTSVSMLTFDERGAAIRRGVERATGANVIDGRVTLHIRHKECGAGERPGIGSALAVPIDFTA